MTVTLLLEQMFNGLQSGVMLFLIAAGLTLILGIMDFVFLAHGAQVMIGAYAAASLTALTGKFPCRHHAGHSDHIRQRVSA